MQDPSLASAVTEQRNRLSSLQAQLAPRHAAERAELESLAKQRRDLDARVAQGNLDLATAKTSAVNLRKRQQELEHGLSLARRSWVRMGEPVLAGLLLFFAIFLIGLEGDASLLAVEALGLFLGLLVRR